MRKTITTACFTFLTLCFSIPAFAVNSVDFTVVSSKPDEIILELVVPPPEFERVKSGHGEFYRAVIPGYAATTFPGKPELPLYGQLLGIRDGSEPVIEIVEAEKTILTGYTLAPTLKPVLTEEGSFGRVRYIFFLDREAYETDSFLYQNIVEIGFVGYMRDQKVAQIKALPLQYNPVKKELIYHSRIRFKVSFHTQEGRAGSTTGRPKRKTAQNKRPSLKGKTGAYERVLKGALVNYDQIRN